MVTIPHDAIVLYVRQMSLNYIYLKSSPYLPLGPSIFNATGLNFCFEIYKWHI